MIIAVMSDSHDHIWHMERALQLVKHHGAEAIIHCGDLIAPFILKQLDTSEIPVHCVFGNNDGDQYQLTRLALTELSWITLHGVTGRLPVAEDYLIGFTHWPEIAEGMAATGKYRLVCYGHTHQYVETRVQQTIVLNPGEVMGKNGTAGFCLVDTDTSARPVRRVILSCNRKQWNSP